MIDKIRNTILYHIYGDVFGVPFELWTNEFIQHMINKLNLDFVDKNGTKLITKLCKTHKNDFIGQYSDDSEMIIATIDCINNTLNCENLLKYFKQHYTENRGYGYITESILLNDDNPQVKSDNNGGLMRMTPIALWNLHTSDFELKHDIIYNLELTYHNTQKNIDVCYLFCKIIISNILHNLSLNEFINFLQLQINNLVSIKNEINEIIDNFINHGDEYNIINRYDNYSLDVVETFCKTLNIFLYHYDEHEYMFSYGVLYGGDTDTITGIVGALVGSKFDIEINEIIKIENIDFINTLIDKFIVNIKNKQANIQKYDNYENNYICLTKFF